MLFSHRKSGGGSSKSSNKHKRLPKVSPKIVMLGASGVGKTSLIERFYSGKFSGGSISTVGAVYCNKSMVVGRFARTVVEMQLWDTAGQERYRGLVHAYTNGAAGAIVCYSTVHPESLKTAKQWVHELNEKFVDRESTVAVALVGCRGDQAAASATGSASLEQIEAARRDAEEFADEHKLFWIETSAKTGHNVEAMFTAMAEQMPPLVRLRQAIADKTGRSSVIVLGADGFTNTDGASSSGSTGGRWCSSC
eukprot:NODE_3457_length_890_cov_45.941022_g3435_i0.p1 GENE.NODE_3457_length_890_cov_45.941022_g3435_i0~~NODE_3457_length_890_cov_45.941022_g3435_i0.p1  ORF type:complete len:251 (+),score=59.65 NODE_3457_length_890_cov_45.941022_g3435_i0:66-818(+)